ncbi:WD40-repeat-containing domain protein [Irpex lacteus]|nr:WD40-repeat-containing domain protein [Irpex lacteus]
MNMQELMVLERVDAQGSQLLANDDEKLLDKLPCAIGVDFKDFERLGCLPGTRKSILQQLEQWANNNKETRIYWLHGLAGSGKSAIAQSFATKLSEKGQLGANFFCSSKSLDGSNCTKILPTIASQLADRHRSFKESLVENLKVIKHNATSSSLQYQLEHLILAPSRSTFLQSGSPQVIVIDAIDECEDTDQTKELLSLLVNRLFSIVGINMKLFIASRSEVHIQAGLGTWGTTSEGQTPSITVLDLDQVPDLEEVNDDIRLFVTDKLGQLRRLKTESGMITTFAPDWPRPDQIDALVEIFAGSFIVASVILKDLEQPTCPIVDEVDQIIKRRHNESGPREGWHQNLDALYLRILKSLFSHSTSSLPTYISILGALAVALQPPTPLLLQRLSGQERDGVATILRCMPSVVLLDEKTNTVRFGHKSFSDYLARSGPLQPEDPQFHIEINEHHVRMAQRCLEILLDCNNQRSLSHASSNNRSIAVEWDSGKIDEAAKYSCRYFAGHFLVDSGAVMRNSTLINGDLEMGRLEVMVFLGELAGRSLVESPSMVSKWFQDNELSSIFTARDSALRTWMDGDEQFTVFDYGKTLESLIQVLDPSKLGVSEPKFKSRRPAGAIGTLASALEVKIESRSMLRPAIEMPGLASAVEYSNDGRKLGIAGNGFIGLFDPDGKLPATLWYSNTPEDIIRTLSFSPDNQILATALSRNINLWEAGTDSMGPVPEPPPNHEQNQIPKREPLAVLKDGHMADVAKVVFHATNSQLLLSIDDHGHICLWNLTSSTVIKGFLVDHASMWGAICWIPGTGEMKDAVAVGLSTGEVALFDVAAADPSAGERLLCTLMVQSSMLQPKSVDAVSSSHDGTLIVAGSDNCIIVYSVDKRQPLHSMDLGLTAMYQLAVSRSGTQILFTFTSSFNVGFVYFQPESKKEPQIIQFSGHNDGVRSVSFSPDGRSIASVSRDKTMRIWDIHRGSFGGIHSEEKCSQSTDGAWVLDNHRRRVLWVPPLHRGSGRWQNNGSKLLIVRDRGFLTELDFSGEKQDGDKSHSG